MSSKCSEPGDEQSWTWPTLHSPGCPGCYAKGLTVNFHQVALLPSFDHGSWDFTPDKSELLSWFPPQKSWGLSHKSIFFTRFLFQNFPHKWPTWFCGCHACNYSAKGSWDSVFLVVAAIGCVMQINWLTAQGLLARIKKNQGSNLNWH